VAIRTLAVVVAVVLAGCGSLAADPGSAPTLSPAPVPEPTTRAASPLPPGISGGGVADVDALVRAHAAALDGRSFTLRISERYDDLGGFRVLRVERRDRYYFHDATVSVAGNRTEFVDGEHRYSRSTREGLRYELGPAVNRSTAYAWLVALPVRTPLSVGNATVYETRVAGERRYEVHIDRPVHPRFDSFRNYSVRATVHPDGLVSNLTVSYVRVHGDERTSVTRRVQYSGLDTTTVDRPTWVERRWGPDPTPVAAVADR
jgi:hypothetical protein